MDFYFIFYLPFVNFLYFHELSFQFLNGLLFLSAIWQFSLFLNFYGLFCPIFKWSLILVFKLDFHFIIGFSFYIWNYLCPFCNWTFVNAYFFHFLIGLFSQFLNELLFSFSNYTFNSLTDFFPFSNWTFITFYILFSSLFYSFLFYSILFYSFLAFSILFHSFSILFTISLTVYYRISSDIFFYFSFRQRLKIIPSRFQPSPEIRQSTI